MHICGDGGFKMTGMELYTAAREGKKLISIVINNSCLGMVRQWQQLFYNEHYSNTLLTEFDFIGLLIPVVQADAEQRPARNLRKR